MTACVVGPTNPALLSTARPTFLFEIVKQNYNNLTNLKSVKIHRKPELYSVNGYHYFELKLFTMWWCLELPSSAILNNHLLNTSALFRKIVAM
jgi:hypothetical protein